MNTDTHIYNYSSSADPNTKAALTERLYPSIDEASAYLQPVKNESSSAFDTLKHMIDIDAMTSQAPIHKGNNSILSHDIEQTIQDYYGFQSSQLSNYLDRWLRRPLLPDHCLQIFHGWNRHETQQNISSPLETPSLFLGDMPLKSTGGFYLRWNNMGIVINPGKTFLFHFHQAGLHIKDIDIVIVTREDASAYADIEEIYNLNSRLNRASGEQQIIHYYLNQKAYRELSTLLKPHSKLERNAIHCLELFAESPETEQIKIGEGILLHYFMTQPPFSLSSPSYRHQLAQSNLGIRLELSKSHANENSNITLGYVSGVSWSPFMGHHLAKCDILLAGIGDTNQNDYNKVVHLNDCLGYYGICSLLEDTLPKVLICTEFGSREGDLRLELVKKMRAEYGSKSTIILPADIGMCMDLRTLGIKCSMTQQYIRPDLIKIVRTSGLFGLMIYLAPANYL